MVANSGFAANMLSTQSITNCLRSRIFLFMVTLLGFLMVLYANLGQVDLLREDRAALAPFVIQTLQGLRVFFAENTQIHKIALQARPMRQRKLLEGGERHSLTAHLGGVAAPALFFDDLLEKPRHVLKARRATSNGLRQGI